MLTVKKFGLVFDLSIGGYVSAFVGFIISLFAIVVFPPDIDLSGKFRDNFEWKSSVELWSFAFSDDSLAEANRIVSTTIATFTEATTEDDDENDDDSPMTEHEKRDEVNDGEKNAKISLEIRRRRQDTKRKMFIFINFLQCCSVSTFVWFSSDGFWWSLPCCSSMEPLSASRSSCFHTCSCFLRLFYLLFFWKFCPSLSTSFMSDGSCCWISWLVSWWKSWTFII